MISNKKSLTKEQALQLFEEPKLIDYSPEEIHDNWLEYLSIMGNYMLEGAEYEESFVLLLKEAARGEFLDENLDNDHLEKNRLEKKLKKMAEYGLTVDDINVYEHLSGSTLSKFHK